MGQEKSDSLQERLELCAAVLEANETIEGVSVADAIAELKALADSQNAQAEYILARHHEKEDPNESA